MCGQLGYHDVNKNWNIAKTGWKHAQTLETTL